MMTQSLLSLFFLAFASTDSFGLAFAPPRTFIRANLVTRNLFNTETQNGEPKIDAIGDFEDYIEIPFEGYFDGTKPESSFKLAWTNFFRQLPTIATQGLQAAGLMEEDLLRPPKCLNLKLSNEAVYEAERLRNESGGGVEDIHPVSNALYKAGCLLLDELFDGRPIQRFWFLEIIARIPYFSYVSMLHLYESLGWWRAVELRKVHYAEEWNVR